MTRDLGNEILSLWRSGDVSFNAQTINQALRATGDLRPVERKSAQPMTRGVDTLPHRVWRSALAGGNSAAIAA